MFFQWELVYYFNILNIKSSCFLQVINFFIMKIFYYSHSTILINCNNKNLLIDPFFTDNPIFIKKKINIEYYFNNLKVDYILVTHAHYDHTHDVEIFAKKNNCILISNYEIANFFSKKNIKTLGINYGSFLNFDFGLLRYVYAAHSSSFLDGTYGGNPGGFILKSEGKYIYISGDTSLTQEMKLIPNYINNEKLDLAILPIGGKFTMDINDALLASHFINCEKILGVHYNTFSLINIDENYSKKIFKKKNKKLILLDLNSYIKI